MSKPPKEQARDYVWHNYGEGDFNEHNWDRSAEEIWLAGYKAAMKEYDIVLIEEKIKRESKEVLMKLLEQRAKEIAEDK